MNWKQKIHIIKIIMSPNQSQCRFERHTIPKKNLYQIASGQGYTSSTTTAFLESVCTWLPIRKSEFGTTPANHIHFHLQAFANLLLYNFNSGNSYFTNSCHHNIRLQNGTTLQHHFFNLSIVRKTFLKSETQVQPSEVYRSGFYYQSQYMALCVLLCHLLP